MVTTPLLPASALAPREQGLVGDPSQGTPAVQTPPWGARGAASPCLRASLPRENISVLCPIPIVGRHLLGPQGTVQSRSPDAPDGVAVLPFRAKNVGLATESLDAPLLRF